MRKKTTNADLIRSMIINAPDVGPNELNDMLRKRYPARKFTPSHVYAIWKRAQTSRRPDRPKVEVEPEEVPTEPYPYSVIKLSVDENHIVHQLVVSKIDELIDGPQLNEDEAASAAAQIAALFCIKHKFERTITSNDE